MPAPITRRTLLQGALLGIACAAPGIAPMAAAAHPVTSERRAGTVHLDYRLFIAQTGTADLKRTRPSGGHYFSLTGVIVRYRDIDAILTRPFDNLKATYLPLAAGPVIFQHKEMKDKKPPFDGLRDPKRAARFNDDLLALLRTTDYTVITATIDQIAYHQSGSGWLHNPYHFCLMPLFEGYARWLDKHSATGDMILTSRGGQIDLRLKAAFAAIWKTGTDQVRPDRLRPFLTSKQLKVKPSDQNIAGLQLADLLATPCLIAATAAQKKLPLSTGLDAQIAQIMRDTKFDRAPNGTLDGWGITWIE